jgi:phospholipase A1/A2
VLLPRECAALMAALCRPSACLYLVLATLATLILCGLKAPVAHATQPSPSTQDWAQCKTLTDPQARLLCFDNWARQQSTLLAPRTPITPPTLSTQTEDVLPVVALPDCRSGKQSELSRFWELEAGSDCGRFNIRAYRPISLSWTTSDSVNTAPSSPTPGHTASSTDYLPTEGRIQLSIRTKIAQGFLNPGDPSRRDSLWFAYSQQSYWQIFASGISRPFRVTDHEPELMYIVPTPLQGPLGWQLRYSGISLNHQSNGQSLPLSRSWNRVILMAGMEKDDRFTLTGRVWQRLPEEAATDDNPGISDLVGRAELAGSWNMNKQHRLSLTVRHALRAQANGSYRLEWSRALGDRASGLRFHTQLFSGFGDSLLDFNYQRTVLSVGLSLVDW